MQHKQMAGFTLIELMITVAILAILTSLALGSYRSYIVRANRTAAQSFMQEVAAREERFLLDNRQYALGADALVNLGITAPAEINTKYDFTVEDNDESSTVPGYLITAAPKGSQSDQDACGDLTLNHLGQKAAAPGVERCWD